MRIILRTAAILVAALAVAGALLALGQAGLLQGFAERGGRERPGLAAQAGQPAGERIGHDDHDDHDGASLRGLAEVAKNLTITGVIVALVVVVGNVIPFSRGQARRARPVEGADHP